MTRNFTWSANGNLLTKGPFTFSYDSDNMLKQAVEVDPQNTSTVVGDTKFFYDQNGQRFMKAHTRTVGAGSGTTIKTWYMGDGLELREKYVGVTSGTPTGTFDSWQATKYIYGIDGKKISSITGQVKSSATAPTSGTLFTVAAGYSASSITGLAGKVYYTFYGIYAHESFAKVTRISALVMLALILLTWLLLSHPLPRLRRPLPANAERGMRLPPLHMRGEGGWGGGGFSLFHRSAALLLMLPIFLVVNCNWLQIPGSLGFSQAQLDSTLVDLYTGLPAGTVYYSHNHLGSGMLVTDEVGNEVFRITYDEYGQIDLENSGKYNPVTDTIEHNLPDAKILLTAIKYTGQEYDPETGLYYYNGRYFDPQLGVFTSADTKMPDANDPMSYNRHMYVRGNPIRYSDPTGHWWFDDVVEAVGKAVTATVAVAFAPITAVVVASAAIYSAATNTNLGTNLITGFNDVSRGVGYGIVGANIGGAMAGLGIIGGAFAAGSIGGITASAHGGEFWDGFFQGAAGGAFMGMLGSGIGGMIGGSNGFLAGANDIYSKDGLGMEAFFKDSSVSLPMTAIGLGKAGIELVGNADYERDLSRGANSFIFTNSVFGRSNSVGNVVSIDRETTKYKGTPYFNRVLREELLHSWQYRAGGLVNGAKLLLEQASADREGFPYPYATPGTLEYDASTRSYNGGSFVEPMYYKKKSARPWELTCASCGKFFP